ncbi:MAG: hypothetical protein N4A65_00915 [Cohaesibacter sp.]|nr:hypothetical protein [Cohaesibacter sp.]
MAWRGRGPISWLIRHVTGGAHTHVGVAWWLHGRLFILEAREGVGVQIRAASAASSFDWINTGLFWREDVEQFALSKLGKPYSYLDALQTGLGFHLTQDGYICSEYAAELFRRMDARASLLSSPTPTDLVQFWLDQGASLRSIQHEKREALSA